MTPAGPTRAYIGLGANLGDAVGTLRAVLRRIEVLPGLRLVACSGLWRSAPIDADGPDFINAVAALDTDWAPIALLDHLLALEAAHGRQRPYRHAPRTLDLDLLLHGALCWHSERLVLPHPRLHQRAFVLRPLAQLAPDLLVPGHGRVRDLLAGVADQRIEALPETAS